MMEINTDSSKILNTSVLNTRKRKATCISLVEEKLWCQNCKRKKKCTADFGDIDKRCWCSGCRSGKICDRSKVSQFDKHVNAIMSESSERQSLAPDVFNPGIFWRRSLPEIARRQGTCGSTNLGNLMPEHEKVCDFQVKMFQKKIKKYSPPMGQFESEMDNMFLSRRDVNSKLKKLNAAEYAERSLRRHVQKVLSYVQHITKKDPEKVLGLVSKLYSKVVASENRNQNSHGNKHLL
jgi:hypothetical protein